MLVEYKLHANLSYVCIQLAYDRVQISIILLLHIQ